jgi:integrase/recombinase XerD
VKVSLAITEYVRHKRELGFRYAQEERRLLRFSRFIGDVELSSMSSFPVARYLGTPEGNLPAWHENYLRLSRFFDYWTLRQEMPSFSMPPRPSRRRSLVRFHVYSLSELRSLLGAVEQCQSRSGCAVSSEPLKMLLILLYSTGMTIWEVIDLKIRDVDLKAASITVSNRKYGSRRLVPIGRDLAGMLGSYIDTEVSRNSDAPLLSNKTEHAFQGSQATYAFARLRKIAGIASAGDPFPPRLLDFRATFAVNRIRAWIAQGANLNRMLPALAAYMGMSGVGALDKYLDLTPESFASHIAVLSLSGRR